MSGTSHTARPTHSGTSEPAWVRRGLIGLALVFVFLFYLDSLSAWTVNSGAQPISSDYIWILYLRRRGLLPQWSLWLRGAGQ